MLSKQHTFNYFTNVMNMWGVKSSNVSSLLILLNSDYSKFIPKILSILSNYTDVTEIDIKETTEKLFKEFIENEEVKKKVLRFITIECNQAEYAQEDILRGIYNCIFNAVKNIVKSANKAVKNDHILSSDNTDTSTKISMNIKFPFIHNYICDYIEDGLYIKELMSELLGNNLSVEHGITNSKMVMDSLDNLTLDILNIYESYLKFMVEDRAKFESLSKFLFWRKNKDYYTSISERKYRKIATKLYLHQNDMDTVYKAYEFLLYELAEYYLNFGIMISNIAISEDKKVFLDTIEIKSLFTRDYIDKLSNLFTVYEDIMDKINKVYYNTKLVLNYENNVLDNLENIKELGDSLNEVYSFNTNFSNENAEKLKSLLNDLSLVVIKEYKYKPFGPIMIALDQREYFNKSIISLMDEIEKVVRDMFGPKFTDMMSIYFRYISFSDTELDTNLSINDRDDEYKGTQANILNTLVNNIDKKLEDIHSYMLWATEDLNRYFDKETIVKFYIDYVNKITPDVEKILAFVTANRVIHRAYASVIFGSFNKQHNTIISKPSEINTQDLNLTLS